MRRAAGDGVRHRHSAAQRGDARGRAAAARRVAARRLQCRQHSLHHRNAGKTGPCSSCLPAAAAGRRWAMRRVRAVPAALPLRQHQPVIPKVDVGLFEFAPLLPARMRRQRPAVAAFAARRRGVGGVAAAGGSRVPQCGLAGGNQLLHQLIVVGASQRPDGCLPACSKRRCSQRTCWQQGQRCRCLPRRARLHAQHFGQKLQPVGLRRGRTDSIHAAAAAARPVHRAAQRGGGLPACGPAAACVA